MIPTRTMGAAFFAAFLWATAVGPAISGETPGKAGLAVHRAVYDLKLADSRGKVESVRGRILYDFSGNACEGYALQFRQVSEVSMREGKSFISDLRSATWEDAEAKSFRFTSQNFIDENLSDSVDGKAERGTSDVAVNLAKPENKTATIDAAVIFPTEHMRKIIAAAREGKTVLELPVFDGSETGEKVYDTLTVIGAPIAPDTKTDDATANESALAGLTRWPVNISYFDKSKQTGEQLPSYGIRFELYENGISRALVLDYNDFVLSAQMTSLEIKPSTPCTP